MTSFEEFVGALFKDIQPLSNFDIIRILHKNQFGFRRKVSTCTALLQLVDKISTSIDKRKTTIGVFIDLAKAFDTVDHQIL